MPSKNKFKTQKYNTLRWFAFDINFKLLHTGCPNAPFDCEWAAGKEATKKLVSFVAIGQFFEG